MKTIILASNNPVKIQATLQGFQRMFPAEEFSIRQVSVPSDVSAQPSSDQETYQGASDRVEKAFLMNPEADFWVGIEGGVEEADGELSAVCFFHSAFDAHPEIGLRVYHEGVFDPVARSLVGLLVRKGLGADAGWDRYLPDAELFAGNMRWKPCKVA